MINPSRLLFCWLYFFGTLIANNSNKLDKKKITFKEQLACANVTLKTQAQHLSIPKRFAYMIRDIWFLQPRLIAKRGKHINRILTHPRFRAAYDFLLLRAKADDISSQQAVKWWTALQKENKQHHKKNSDPS